MLSKFRKGIGAGQYVTPRARTGDRGGVLRVSVQREAGSAKAYYRQGEYYAEGLELAGTWGGLAAKRLGLEGEVDKRDFAALCDNQHPDGSTLTARTRISRRCLFDLNFHVPKSVSILHGLFGDDAILDAFQTAVSETMVAVEAEIRTRVRRGGRDETRTTGNLVYARFVHTTARPVHGIPDPHLHAHCCVFNATFDDHEGLFKAIELGEVYASLPFHEAAFHARLARSLVRLGYDVSRTRTGWEISGVPDRVLKAFSRRTEQIESVARELGLTDARSKDRLGAMTRTGKRKDRSLEELRIEWRARLTDAERAALESVIRREVPVAGLDPDAARSAMSWAIEHCFERESVVPVSKLLASALRYGVGSVSVEELVRELVRPYLLLRERDGRHLVTTRAILHEESRMLAFARTGRGRCPSLGRPESPPALGSLGPDQAAAVRHLLSSPDRVMIVRGAAGTGKTALMTAAVNAIQENSQRVVTLAPSADASRGVLRESGFPNADTVAKFLVDERLQIAARGQVLWIDEAGLLGTRTLSALFRIAESLGARVILSGDIRQHGPVERGLPLRLLETDAGIVPAEVTTIRRQRGGYRDAVQSLAEGRTVDGFDRLADLGWVIEAGDDVRDERLAEEYAANLKRGKSTLVVAPTHAEGRRVTAAIRRTLQATGRLSTDETVYIRLEGKNLTVAEQKLPANYSMGDAVEFHSRVPGFKTNLRYTVHRVGRASVAVRDPAGRLSILPLQHAATLTVYSVHELALAVGDRVRLTKNGWSSGRTTRLDNGRLETVERLLADGRIQLASGIRIDPGFGHLDYGYAVTSHAAQGKTVDRVLLAISSLSFAASGREQFYVSASRGRERVTVFTDDAIALRRVIERTDPKVSATDLVRDDLPSLSVWRAWVSRRVDAVRRAAREARQALRGLSSLGSSVGPNFAVNRDEIPRRPA